MRERELFYVIFNSEQHTNITNVWFYNVEDIMKELKTKCHENTDYEAKEILCLLNSGTSTKPTHKTLSVNSSRNFYCRYL